MVQRASMAISLTTFSRFVCSTKIRVQASLLVVAPLMVACLRFQPRPPLVGASQSANARIVSLTKPGIETRATIDLRLTQKATIRTIHVTEPSRVPCSDGALANPIMIDGQEGNLALPAGDHVLDATLPVHATDFHTGLVADIQLAIGDQTDCIRVPFASRAIHYVPTSKRVVMFGLEGLGGSHVAGQFGMGSLRAGYGGWLGSWRVTAETGIGATTCTARMCGQNPRDNSLKQGWAWPVALSAEWLRLPDRGNPTLTQGFGLGLRYVSSLSHLTTLEGPKWRTLQGIYFVPAWIMGDTLPLSFSYQRHPSTVDLELPLGVWSSAGDQGAEFGFSIGIGVRGAVPL